MAKLGIIGLIAEEEITFMSFPSRLASRLPAAGLLFSLAATFTILSTAAAALRTEPLSGGASGTRAQGAPPQVGDPIYMPAVFRTHRIVSGPTYGLNFISSAEHPADEQQYLNGLSTGAEWNRWPLYWFNIELSEGSFDWSTQDATIAADMARGLRLDAILLGTPPFYTTDAAEASGPPAGGPAPGQPADGLSLTPMQAAAPEGLYEPVFDDGSDMPGPGKQINPINVWARFVYLAVERYKPGGVLAEAEGWQPDTGVSHWEIWNEPDLPIFWDSSLQDYARLLKVAYLAIEQADPAAQVLFGGIANNAEQPDYYRDVLEYYAADPMAAGFAYFHDIFATHSYYYAWQSWNVTYSAGQDQADFGLAKPIWLNETGVPAWNDYPGPTWDPLSWFRATMAESADYTIQTTMYAGFAGADAIFHFQLYDGCGNQPPGTDFPPHDGELCGTPEYPICAGDAYGLFRNPADAACFTQHPNPETPRPNYAAYQVVTSHLHHMEPLWRLRPGGATPSNGPQEWIAFYRPGTQERIVGMWARFGEPQTAVLTATHTSALKVLPDGATETIYPVDGFYTLQLAAATNQNKPPDWPPELFPIGGRPVLVIEPDTQGPTVQLRAELSGSRVKLSWQADDRMGAGVQSYDLAVAVDQEPAVAWLLSVADTQASYLVEPGRQYHFSLTAFDRAGNQGAAGLSLAVPPAGG
ncbi:MAG: hypothetical protein ACRDHL_03350 [Candidatus Promineifilaceae bacterium]